MTHGIVVHKHQPRTFTIHLNAFSVGIRILFIAIVCGLVIAELASVPLWPPPIYYPYQLSKLTGFVVIGLLSPLAFWRFNASIGACCMRLFQPRLSKRCSPL